MVQEGKNKLLVLYVEVGMAIYGMLISAMLFYKKLASDLEGYSFKINPYDPCVMNKMVKDSQLTVSWHVDDLKISHIKPSVVDDFLAWVTAIMGSIGEVKVSWGNVHQYLGKKLNYTVPRQVSINMVEYVKAMVDNLPPAWEYLSIPENVVRS